MIVYDTTYTLWRYNMSGSVNKVTLVGNLGRDPEVRAMQNGDKIIQLSVATSDRWKDKSTGEQREKTEWHRVVIFNDALGKIAEQYLKKGSTVYLEGQLQTRNLMGATNPSESTPGSIRGDLATELDKNVVHGSDSDESAERELSLFFGK